VTVSSNDDWLSLSAAAKLLGVHPTTLRMWADQGDLPTHRTPGNHRRFRRADIETWGAARRETRPSTAQLIVQHALGRTRMHMSEGQMNQLPWYQRLNDSHKHEFREASRHLLGLLVRYLRNDEAEATLAAEAKAIGAHYEQLGRNAGMPLSEKVGVFAFFRDFLYDSVIEVYQASGQRAAREWAAMHRQITTFTNLVLLGLIEAHEQKG